MPPQRGGGGRPDAASFTAFDPAGAAPCAARESLDRYLEKCGGRAPPPPPPAPSLLPLYGYSLGLAAALAVLVRRIGVERFGTISADLANRYAALLHAAAHAPRAGGGGGAAAAAASGANPNAIATAAALPPPLPPAAAVQVAALHLFALHEVSQLPPAHAAASATAAAAAALPPPLSPSLLTPPAPLPPLLPLALALALRWLGDTLQALPRLPQLLPAAALLCRWFARRPWTLALAACEAEAQSMLAALAALVNTLPQGGESASRRTVPALLGDGGHGDGDGDGDAAARGGDAADAAAAAQEEESEEEWGALLEEDRELHGFLPASRPAAAASLSLPPLPPPPRTPSESECRRFRRGRIWALARAAQAAGALFCYPGLGYTSRERSATAGTAALAGGGGAGAGAGGGGIGGGGIGGGGGRGGERGGRGGRSGRGAPPLLFAPGAHVAETAAPAHAAPVAHATVHNGARAPAEIGEMVGVTGGGRGGGKGAGKGRGGGGGGGSGGAPLSQQAPLPLQQQLQQQQQQQQQLQRLQHQLDSLMAQQPQQQQQQPQSQQRAPRAAVPRAPPAAVPPGGPKPLIVIDAPNVAIRHGRSQTFSCRGIEIAIAFWARRGHRAVAFLPEFHLNYDSVGASKRSVELGLKDPKQVPPWSTMIHHGPLRPQAGARRLTSVILTRAAYSLGARRRAPAAAARGRVAARAHAAAGL